ncbi:MAG: LamG-like jellyroll fold domain-containing protein [Dehalococcoidia bacterium]
MGARRSSWGRFALLPVLAVVLALGAVADRPPASEAAAPNAVRLSGSGQFIRVPNRTALRLTTNFTVELWMKPGTMTTARGLLNKDFYQLRAQPSGSGVQVVFEVRISGTNRSVTSGVLPTNQWHHVAATYDGANLRLFANGVLVSAAPQTGSVDRSTRPLYLGAGAGGGSPFAGTIDEVRISKVVRYTGNFVPPSAAFANDGSTAGLWHLDEGSGTSTSDSSSTSATGTLVGGAVWTPDSPFGGTGGDQTPPTLNFIQAGSVTANGATITWSTDEPATTQVEYGTTSSFGSASPLQTGLTTGHTVVLAGLLPNTTYSYRVHSRDAAGNLATSSPARTFQTAAAGTGTGQWSSLMNWPLVAVHAAMLYTGEVLLFDAWQKPTTTKLWNPTTNQMRDVSVNEGLFCSGHVQLADGRLLVVGGHDPALTSTVAGIRDVNIFDPATGTWSAAADMAELRWYPSATTLADGRVLALSGNTVWGEWANTPEIYDPATNAWSYVSGVDTSSQQDDEYPLTFLLPDGRLFTLANVTRESRFLDPAARTWTPTGLGLTPAANASATMYLPGRILISGGGTYGSNSDALTTTAVVDLTAATPQWRTIAPMTYARYMHNLVVLPDGKVLAVGGSTKVSTGATTGVLPAELWDPATETWTVLPAIAQPRMYHSTAVLLPDGRVLSAGGGRYNNTTDYFGAQTYAPAYLSAGPRPTIAGAPASAAWGASVAVTSPEAGTVARVALANLGSVTHSLDMGQHYAPLSFTVSGSTLSVTMPANGNIAPPGYYMLFLINAQGVPSVAHMVRIGAAAGPDVTPPSISGAAVVTVTDTTATVQWTTNEAASGQVRYGTSPASLTGSTALDASLTFSKSQTITGLQPSTQYSCVIRARDAAGNEGTSAPLTFTTAATPPPPPAAPLVGTTQVLTWTDSNIAGSAQAFQFTAATSGTVTKLALYLDAGSAATQVVVGLYTDVSNKPVQLLTSAPIASPVNGAWNTVTVPGVTVVAGTKYWIALLSPAGAGEVRWRGTQFGGGWSAITNATNLALLPGSWSGVAWQGNSPISAWGGP